MQAPDGRQLLVDGGPSPTALFNGLGDVLPFWDRSLDLVVLTHPDGDHITGLIPLLDRYRVGQVLDVRPSDAAPATRPGWRDWQRSACRAPLRSAACVCRLVICRSLCLRRPCATGGHRLG